MSSISSSQHDSFISASGSTSAPASGGGHLRDSALLQQYTTIYSPREAFYLGGKFAASTESTHGKAVEEQLASAVAKSGHKGRSVTGGGKIE